MRHQAGPPATTLIWRAFWAAAILLGAGFLLMFVPTARVVLLQLLIVACEGIGQLLHAIGGGLRQLLPADAYPLFI